MQFTVREAARYLNVSEKSIYRWAGSGEMPVYRVNGQYRFNPTELLEWATSRKMRVSTDVFRKEEPTQALPGVAQALQAGGIFHKLAGADKKTVLRSMVDTLRLPERIERDTLFEILVARESLGTTAIGGGIAIPHVRSPIVLPVTGCAITLCFLETPVDFGAADGQPVHTLFWLVSPTIKTHMHMLSRLATVLRDPAFQALLSKRASAEEILAETRRIESAIQPSAEGRQP